MKYTVKARKGLTLGDLRELVSKLDGAPDDAVVRSRGTRAKEISVDEGELRDGSPPVADEWANPGLIERGDPR